jgi:signal transduction histidine kinase
MDEIKSDSFVEKQFEQEEEAEFVKQLRSLCIYIGPPVNIYFIFVDYQISGDKFLECFLGRLFMFLSYAGVLAYTQNGSRKHIKTVTNAFAWFHAGVVAYISLSIGNMSHPYFLVGPCIISLATNLIWRSAIRVMILNMGIFGLFLVPGLILHGVPSPEIMYTFLATIVTFIVIPIVILNLLMTSRRNEFLARTQLNEALQQRDKIISEKVNEIMAASDVIKKKEAEIQSTQQLSDLAARVAHDIRSPLTALGIVTYDIHNIPEDRRKLIQNAVGRINDIANSLLSYRKNQSPKTQANTLFAIGPAIDRAVSEKRFERSDQRNVRISYLETLAQYGAFVELPLKELERHVSNILNNAIEAIGESGEVNAYIWRADKEIALRIDDNGPGIPPEVLKNVGVKGFTTSKNGHGLGIFHAREFLKGIGGNLSIESERGRGTTVILNIPVAKTPTWCLDKLEIARNTNVVVVDDDSSILDVWQKRVPDSNLVYFSDPARFVAARLDKSKFTFLVDYEFRNDRVNGLDLIEKEGISDRTILVTSRFEDVEVLQRAQQLGVRILPKNWISIVPVESL